MLSLKAPKRARRLLTSGRNCGLLVDLDKGLVSDDTNADVLAADDLDQVVKMLKNLGLK